MREATNNGQAAHGAPRMEAVAPPPGGAGGLIDRAALEAAEPRAREVWLALAKREYGRARQVIDLAEREQLLAGLVGGATPLAELFGSSSYWMRSVNLLDAAGIVTVGDLVESPAASLAAVPHVSPAMVASLLQEVVRRIVRVE